MAPTMTTEKGAHTSAASSNPSSSSAASAADRAPLPRGGAPGAQYPSDEDHHARGMLQAMHEMQQQQEMCDMQVIAEGVPVQVHSLVLASCSTYFRSLLCTSKSGDWQTLDMPRISKANLKVLVSYAYTGRLDVSTQNVKEILHTSLLYGFAGAAQICESFVQREGKEKAKKGIAPVRTTIEQECCNRPDTVIQMNRTIAATSGQKKISVRDPHPGKGAYQERERRNIANPPIVSLMPPQPEQRKTRSLPERQRRDFQIIQRSQNLQREMPPSSFDNEPVALLRRFVNSELHQPADNSMSRGLRSRVSLPPPLIQQQNNPMNSCCEMQQAALDLTSSSANRKRKHTDDVQYPSKVLHKQRSQTDKEHTRSLSSVPLEGAGVPIAGFAQTEGLRDVSQGAIDRPSAYNNNSKKSPNGNSSSTTPSNNNAANVIQRNSRSNSTLVRRESNLSTIIRQKKLSLENSIDHLIEKAQKNQQNKTHNLASQKSVSNMNLTGDSAQCCITISSEINHSDTVEDQVTTNTSNSQHIGSEKINKQSETPHVEKETPKSKHDTKSRMSKTAQKEVKQKQRTSKRNAVLGNNNNAAETTDKNRYGRKPFLRSQRVDLLKAPLYGDSNNRQKQRTVDPDGERTDQSLVSENNGEISAEFLRAMNLKRNPVKPATTPTACPQQTESDPKHQSQDDTVHQSNREQSKTGRESRLHKSIRETPNRKGGPQNSSSGSKRKTRSVEQHTTSSSHDNDELDDSGISMTLNEPDSNVVVMDVTTVSGHGMKTTSETSVNSAKHAADQEQSNNDPDKQPIEAESNMRCATLNQAKGSQVTHRNSESHNTSDGSCEIRGDTQAQTDSPSNVDKSVSCGEVKVSQGISDVRSNETQIDVSASDRRSDGSNLTPEINSVSVMGNDDDCAIIDYQNVLKKNNLNSPSSSTQKKDDKLVQDVNKTYGQSIRSYDHSDQGTVSLDLIDENRGKDDRMVTNLIESHTSQLPDVSNVSSDQHGKSCQILESRSSTQMLDDAHMESRSSTQMLDDAHMVLTSLEILNNSDHLSASYMDMVTDNHAQDVAEELPAQENTEQLQIESSSYYDNNKSVDTHDTLIDHETSNDKYETLRNHEGDCATPHSNLETCSESALSSTDKEVTNQSNVLNTYLSEDVCIVETDDSILTAKVQSTRKHTTRLSSKNVKKQAPEEENILKSKDSKSQNRNHNPNRKVKTSRVKKHEKNPSVKSQTVKCKGKTDHTNINSTEEEKNGLSSSDRENNDVHFSTNEPKHTKSKRQKPQTVKKQSEKATSKPKTQTTPSGGGKKKSDVVRAPARKRKVVSNKSYSEMCSSESDSEDTEIDEDYVSSAKTDANGNSIRTQCRNTQHKPAGTSKTKNVSGNSKMKRLRGKNVQIGKCVRCKLRFVDEASYRFHAKICKGALHHSYYRVPKAEKPEEDKKPKLQSTSDYKYMCDQCGHQAHRPNQLDVHKYSKHNIPYDPSKYQVITCQEKGCSYMTIKSASMREHIYNCHSGKMPFVCEQCGKCFRRKIGLKLHLRTHGIGAQPAACNICGLEFKQKGNLRAHVLRVHLGEKPYTCSHCPYSSFTRFDLDYHKLKRHSIPLPKSKISRHICEVCDFIARTKFDLDKHRRIHTGERPYECDICNNSYYTANSLKTHILVVHTSPGDRPFKCTYADCDFGAISKSKLKEHVRSIHTKEKPYICSHCGYGAAIKGNLTKHIQKKHGTG